ncbi:Delta(24)-sterol C-methyltransferase [Steccherinum ochraceum]|uniref:Sterol 24-C-methyltransferase n=1 Tax=Steccherinum ochraceum TaxID=92696 RepID=A0A4R0RZL1_9APHY|nr:Delta(24)-sterol C-methyltransferase [Steccherinum ochraceum]
MANSPPMEPSLFSNPSNAASSHSLSFDTAIFAIARFWTSRVSDALRSGNVSTVLRALQLPTIRHVLSLDPDSIDSSDPLNVTSTPCRQDVFPAHGSPTMCHPSTLRHVPNTSSVNELPFLLPTGRLALENQIRIHTQAIATLKCQMNQLNDVPMTRLPPEILGHVFACYAETMQDYDQSRSGQTRYYSWILVTHVCHHWRQVALNTPSLWGDIFISRIPPSPTLLQEVIHRSKHTPLRVHAVIVSQNTVDAFRLVVPEFDRVEKLRLSIVQHYFQTLSDQLPLIMPHLRTLDIRCLPTHSSSLQAISAGIPIFFNQCTLPSLRVMKLASCYLDWKTMALAPSLTRLEVEHPIGVSKASFEDILCALEKSPALEHLSLCHALPFFTGCVSHGYATMRMPRMKTLKLWSEAPSSARFLGLLDIPAFTRISLSFPSLSDADMQIVVQSLKSRQLFDDTRPGHCVERLFVGGDTICLWKGSPGHGTDPEPHLRLRTSSYEPDLTALVAALCSHIPLHTVRTLEMGSFNPMRNVPSSMEVWTRLLDCMPRVQSLILTGSDGFGMDEVLSILLPRPRNALQASSSPTLHLSQVRELTLKQIALRNFDGEDGLRCVQALARALSARDQMEMRFEKCNLVKEDDVSWLRQFARVEWDGWTYGAQSYHARARDHDWLLRTVEYDGYHSSARVKFETESSQDRTNFLATYISPPPIFPFAIHRRQIAVMTLAITNHPMLQADGRSQDRMTNYDKFWDQNLKKDTEEHNQNRLSSYAELVNGYYDGATVMYEYAWSGSFHFSRFNKGEGFFASLARHEHYLAAHMQLKPGMRVLDIGCGVGGPAREIAAFADVYVVGVNNNEYQVGRATKLTEKAGLSERVSFVKGDFMSLVEQFGPNSFDAVFSIEAAVHAPSWEGVYAQIEGVLKPGGIFGLYEWAMTDRWDPSIPLHKEIAHKIEIGSGVPEMRAISLAREALKTVGFEILHEEDLAERPDSVPWYYPLEGNLTKAQTLRDLVLCWATTSYGMFVNHTGLWMLEKVGVVPTGTWQVSETLKIAADGLSAGGRLKLFTPMYLVVSQKKAL